MKHPVFVVMMMLVGYPCLLVPFDPGHLDTQEGFYYDDIQQPDFHPDLSGVPNYSSELLVDEDGRHKKEENAEIRSIVSDVVKGNDATIQKHAQALAADASKLKHFVEHMFPREHTVQTLESYKIPPFVYALLEKQYADPLFDQKKVSLSLKKVSLCDALELLGKNIGINFILEGSKPPLIETINVADVSLKAALKALLSNTLPEYALISHEGIYRIMPLKKALIMLKNSASGGELADYVRLVTRLNHVTLSESFKLRLEKMWQSIVGSDYTKHGTFLLIDDASKKVFYRAKNSYAHEFEAYLHEIDMPTPQVTIEARLVIAKKDFEESFGTQWSSIYNRRSSIKHGMEFVGSGPLKNITNHPRPQTIGNLMDWAFNFFPDSAIHSRTIKIPLVFGGNNLNTKRLNLVLNAAESRKELRTILKPTVLTNHAEEAEILVGQNVPIATTIQETIEGSLRDINTASYRDVGIKLRVRPFVFPDQSSIFMDIYVENSSQIPEGQFPLITTTRSKSRVILKSGQTTMISGLIEDTHRFESTELPFISKIPVLGWLFKGYDKKIIDHQMLIFITPTVV